MSLDVLKQDVLVGRPWGSPKLMVWGLFFLTLAWEYLKISQEDQEHGENSESAMP